MSNQLIINGPLENIIVNGRVCFKVSDFSAILVDFEQKTHF